MLNRNFHRRKSNLPGQAPGEDNQQTRDRVLMSRYWIIPVIISLFLLALFISTYILTNREETTAAEINTSGRQRMLALEISFLSQSMALETSVAGRRPLRDRLQVSVGEMAKSHDALIKNSTPADMSPAIHKLYFSEQYAIDRMVKAYLDHARQLLQDWKTVDLSNPDLVYILREGPDSVIRNLDILVGQYQKDGENSIASILKIERIILVIGSLLFLVEIIYFGLPLLSRIKRQNTEIVQSRGSLRESRHYTDQLLHALNEHAVVSIADIKGNIIYANSRFCKISGYTIPELINSNHRILKSDAHDKAFFRNLWATIASGQIWQGEICNKSKDGGLYWVQSTIVPFLNENTGLPEQYVAIRTDITDRKKMQDSMDTLYLRAEAANVAKSEFLANMSHELRTPLGHIIGFSQILMMKTLEPDIRENVEYIKNAGDDLLDKVNSFLEFAGDEDREKRNSEKIDIVRLVNSEFVEYFRILARRSKRRFTKSIPDRQIYVQVNSLELLSALRKVAINAAQFSRENDIVGVAFVPGEDNVEITVFDTGPGLPPDILSSNHDPFEIGEPVLTKRKSGMGLGLPLAKRLCLRNGGAFEVTSEEGIGAKIYFKFPILQQGAEDD